jgi:hypothetical protein
MSKFTRVASIATLGAAVVLGSISNSMALPRQSAPHVVRNDSGGYIIDYAIKWKRMEQQQRAVRFDGRCDSACTLFLAMPASRACLTAKARFGFHLPFGSSPRGNRVAAAYLMNSYPAWVRTWINANGGLTNQLKVMPYEYARQHIATCREEPRARLLTTVSYESGN